MTLIVLLPCIYSLSHTHSVPDDDYKIVETLKIKMISIFGVIIFVYLIKILSGYRNGCAVVSRYFELISHVEPLTISNTLLFPWVSIDIFQ